jgi:hypothetical protein
VAAGLGNMIREDLTEKEQWSKDLKEMKEGACYVDV